ncbi:hypothetical protein DOY81_012906, partial [Sarcophaga bullata]
MLIHTIKEARKQAVICQFTVFAGKCTKIRFVKLKGAFIPAKC